MKHGGFTNPTALARSKTNHDLYPKFGVFYFLFIS